jgi:hypothetical protein
MRDARTLPEQVGEPVKQLLDVRDGQGVADAGRFKDWLVGTLAGPVLQVGPATTPTESGSVTSRRSALSG